jgi:hypothetical protein
MPEYSDAIKLPKSFRAVGFMYKIALLINEGERESGRNDSRCKQDSGRNDHLSYNYHSLSRVVVPAMLHNISVNAYFGGKNQGKCQISDECSNNERLW